MGLFSKEKKEAAALNELTPKIKANLNELAEMAIGLRRQNNMRKRYEHGEKRFV